MEQLDKRKNYYIVFDTETIGVDKKFIYDIGYVIIDKKGNIYKKTNYLVKEIFDNQELMESAFYYSKMSIYQRLLKEKQIEKRNFKDIIKELQEDIQKFNIIGIGAYNINFDIAALVDTTIIIYNIYKTKLTFRLTKNNKFMPEFEEFTKKYIFKKDIKIFDIWTMSCMSLANQKTFQALYMERTPKGNIKSSAEKIFQYVSDNKTFIEDHTALSDAIIESKILTRIFKNKIPLKSQVFLPYKLIKGN